MSRVFTLKIWNTLIFKKRRPRFFYFFFGNQKIGTAALLQLNAATYAIICSYLSPFSFYLSPFPQKFILLRILSNKTILHWSTRN